MGLLDIFSGKKNKPQIKPPTPKPTYDPQAWQNEQSNPNQPVEPNITNLVNPAMSSQSLAGQVPAQLDASMVQAAPIPEPLDQSTDGAVSPDIVVNTDFNSQSQTPPLDNQGIIEPSVQPLVPDVNTVTNPNLNTPTANQNLENEGILASEDTNQVVTPVVNNPMPTLEDFGGDYDKFLKAIANQGATSATSENQLAEPLANQPVVNLGTDIIGSDESANSALDQSIATQNLVEQPSTENIAGITLKENTDLAATKSTKQESLELSPKPLEEDADVSITPTENPALEQPQIQDQTNPITQVLNVPANDNDVQITPGENQTSVTEDLAVGNLTTQSPETLQEEKVMGGFEAKQDLNKSSEAIIDNQQAVTRTEKFSENAGLTSRTFKLRKVAFLGVAEAEESLAMDIINFIKQQPQVDTIVLDSNKGAGQKILTQVKQSKIKSIGVYLKTYYSDISDVAEEGTLTDTDISIVYSNYFDQLKQLYKEAQMFVILPGQGVNTLSKVFTMFNVSLMYLGQEKPLILHGNKWQSLLSSLTSFGLASTTVSQIKMSTSVAELSTIYSGLRAKADTNKPAIIPKVLDRRIEGDEADFLAS